MSHRKHPRRADSDLTILQALALSLSELDRRAIAEEAVALAKNLILFCIEAWRVLEPGEPLIWSPHYTIMLEYLTLVANGSLAEKFPGKSGIIFNVPPRTAKSTLITILFPIWLWLQNASMRILCASYAASLSREHSVKRRDGIQSEWFQRRWGHLIELKDDQNRADHFSNTKAGQMIATSIDGSATGRGGEILIVDDPISPMDAMSDATRAHANTFMDQVLKFRLNNPSKGCILVVMQRVHEMDVTGYLLKQEPGRWIHLRFPLEAEQKETIVGPISGQLYVREPGDILQPERFTSTVVASLKRTPLPWASQYQQRPAPLEGNMIRRSDIRFYGGYDEDTGDKDVELPTTFDWVLVSADCAFKDLKTSDYVCIGTIGVVGGRRYMLNVINKHLDLPATEAEILRQRAAYKATHILVEDKANGSAVIKSLQQKISGVIPINPEGQKISRMFATCGAWQSHSWYLDRNAGWTEAFVDQIVTFPNAAHDDMADMMTQAEIYISHGFARPRVSLIYDPDERLDYEPVEGVDF